MDTTKNRIFNERLKTERPKRKEIILQVLKENHGRKTVRVAKERLKESGLIHSEEYVRWWCNYFKEEECL